MGSSQETNLERTNMMQLAIAEAYKGAGFVQTNPMVGSVITLKGKVIAKGHHSKFGGAHAERNSLKKATKKFTKRQLKSAVLYITLEPCSHVGKTPACLPFILESGIKNVVVGSVDPNPQEAGRSIKGLRKAGIKVTVGAAQVECDYLIRAFRKWITTRRPFMLGKVGMSLDGKVTSSEHQQYITNKASRHRVHELRQELDAIMVGVNTVLRDNPGLDTRLDRKRISHPTKIILDSRLRTPSSSTAVDRNTILVCLEGVSMKKKRVLSRTGADILELPPEVRRGKQLFEKMDLQILLKELGKRKISSVLVEGGSYVFTNFINHKAMDEFNIFMAPQLFGATRLPFTYALQYTVNLTNINVELMPATTAERNKGEDDNLLVRGYAQYH